MTHGIHISKLQNNNENKRKCLALNITDEKDSSKRKVSLKSSCEESSDEEELAMLSKRIQRIMKLKKKGKKPTKNNKELTCYNCGKTGHFIADYFKKKKDDKTKEAVKGKKKEFYNKKGKRTMAAAWTDEDESSSESSGAEEIGLMVDHEVTSPSTCHSFMSSSRLTDDDELSHEELVEALSQVCCKLKSVSKKKKAS